MRRRPTQRLHWGALVRGRSPRPRPVPPRPRPHPALARRRRRAGRGGVASRPEQRAAERRRRSRGSWCGGVGFAGRFGERGRSRVQRQQGLAIGHDLAVDQSRLHGECLRQAILAATGRIERRQLVEAGQPQVVQNWRVVAYSAGRPGASRWPIDRSSPRSSSCLTIGVPTATPRMSSMSPRVTGWR